MIQANELRIGNWVEVNGKPTKVENVDEDGINLDIEDGYYGSWTRNYTGYFTMEWYKGAIMNPIPLTAEVLEKCGFEKGCNIMELSDDFFISYDITDGVYLQVEKSKEFKSDYVCERLLLPYIKSLHQLQNLYWCLTGTELTVNL